MELPLDVHREIEELGAYTARMKPIDGDHQVIHDLCAIVSLSHAFPFSEDGYRRLSPAALEVLEGVHSALRRYFGTVGKGVPTKRES